jgi:putative ABC transport system substrate-binding protein
MRRRDFIKGIAGSAAAWPFAVRAQQGERMRRIAAMMGFPEYNRQGRQEGDALRLGLQELGWTDGHNIRIDFHWDVGELGRAQIVGKEIVSTQPDLIVAHTTPTIMAISQLTKTIPVVFVSIPDPVILGLVGNYSQPGGNVTGFTNFEPSMGGKWVELLKDLDPRIRRVALLFNPDSAPAGGKVYLPSMKASSAALGIEAIEAAVRNGTEIERAIDALAREPNGGLILMPDIFINARGELIARLAIDHRLPLIGAFRSVTEDGGLISYGSDTVDLFHRAASYVDRILQGEKPAGLPIQTPTKFEIVINLKTAKALELNISHDFLLRANDVVE